MLGNDLRQAFGQRLRLLRKRRNLTQEQLAALVGCSPEYVRRMERGAASPSFNTLNALAEVLHTEVKDLFDFSASNTE